MSERKTTRATFVIERTFASPPEQGAYLDDFDNVAGREHGTRALIDNLESALQRETVRRRDRPSENRASK